MIRFTSTYGYIDLPNPILGDGEQLDLHTVFQTSMSKAVHSTKLTPSHSSILLNFVDVKQSILEAFELWFTSSRGMTITYTDYKSVTWTGVIVNNPLQVTMTGRKWCGTAIFGEGFTTHSICNGIWAYAGGNCAHPSYTNLDGTKLLFWGDCWFGVATWYITENPSSTALYQRTPFVDDIYGVYNLIGSGAEGVISTQGKREVGNLTIEFRATNI